jgi:hypothetical protein
MEKNNGMNNNIVYVVIVAIVAIVGMVTMFAGSGSKTTQFSDDFFTSDNVAGQAFGGSTLCIDKFNRCYRSGTPIDTCMDQYIACENLLGSITAPEDTFE